MEAINYEDALVIAHQNFAKIEAQGKRFFERNAAKWQRENLHVPFFVTNDGKKKYIHLIQFPEPDEKIHFRKYIIHE